MQGETGDSYTQVLMPVTVLVKDQVKRKSFLLSLTALYFTVLNDF